MSDTHHPLDPHRVQFAEFIRDLVDSYERGKFDGIVIVTKTVVQDQATMAVHADGVSDHEFLTAGGLVAAQAILVHGK